MTLMPATDNPTDADRMNVPAQIDSQVSRYEAARAALAEAKRFPDVKEILNLSAAMKGYAQEAKDREMLADAQEIKLRAIRKLDELRQYQAETIGLNKGGRPKTGVEDTPVSDQPTLDALGIDKNLAKHMRFIGALSEDEFEDRIVRSRKAVMNTATKAFRSTVKYAQNEQLVASDVLEAIKGTPLDTENYVEVLSRLTHEEQRQRVQELLAEPQFDPEAAQRHDLFLLKAAWERASEWARKEFLEWLKAGAPA